LPVDIGLQSTVRPGRPREQIINEAHVVADEYVILDNDAFANERVARNLAAGADDGILLNLNKTTDARLVPHCTAVKVSEAEHLDRPPQADIGSDAVKRFHAVLVVFRRPLFASPCCDMRNRPSLYQRDLLSQA